MKPALLKAEIPPEYQADLGDIYIKRFSYRERITWEGGNLLDNPEPLLNGLPVVLVDAEGKPRFTREEIEQWDSVLCLSLWYQVQEFNVITNADIEALKKSYRKTAACSGSSTSQDNSAGQPVS